MRLLYATLTSAAILKSLKTLLLDAPGVTSGQKSTLTTELSYFDELTTGLATFIAKHLVHDLNIIDETKMSGSTDLLADLDSVIFPMFAISASADYLLGLESTIAKQFWHYIQKVYYYRGVFTNIPPMVITHSKPVVDIRDGVTLVLDDFDAEKSSVTWMLSNISEKEAEKLISLKMHVAAII